LSQDKVKDLLLELQRELSRTEEMDPETLELVRNLDRNIDELIESADNVNSPILDDAIALEARFAASHPVAERLIREVIETLGRIGI
jgi:hypothetical protein